MIVGEVVAETMGDVVGSELGDGDGTFVGLVEGEVDGERLGDCVGLFEGESVGDTVGFCDGAIVVFRDGDNVGNSVVCGVLVGSWFKAVRVELPTFFSGSTSTEKEAVTTSSRSPIGFTKIALLKSPGRKKSGSRNGNVKLLNKPIRSEVSFALRRFRAWNSTMSSTVGFSERVRYRAMSSGMLVTSWADK